MIQLELDSTISQSKIEFLIFLDVWLLRKVCVVGGWWWVEQQNKVTPSPFDFWLLTLDLDLDLDCDNF